MIKKKHWHETTFLRCQEERRPILCKQEFAIYFYFKCCRNTFYNYKIFFNRFGASHGILLTKINSSLNEKRQIKWVYNTLSMGVRRSFIVDVRQSTVRGIGNGSDWTWLADWTGPCHERGRGEGKAKSQEPGKWEPREATKRQKGQKNRVAKIARLYRNQRSWGWGSPALGWGV